MPEQRDRFVTANRLRLHLLEWGDHGPVLLMLHGFLEHAHAWDWVAPTLADAGYHVFALDWRGHGDSEWIGAGGYYHFVDYVADLAALTRQLGERVILVAHSMGGGAAVLYAGTEPERVSALVSVEGLGLPDIDPHAVLDRVVGWLYDLERVAARPQASVSPDVAVARMRERFPHFSEAVARHLVTHGLYRVGDEWRWKFDPLHQTRSPLPMPVACVRAFWPRVACPVLYVEGADSVLRLSEADIEERLTALRAERITIAAAGHHPHLEQPEAFAEAVTTFLARRGVDSRRTVT